MLHFSSHLPRWSLVRWNILGWLLMSMAQPPGALAFEQGSSSIKIYQTGDFDSVLVSQSNEEAEKGHKKPKKKKQPLCHIDCEVPEDDDR